jgi:hypothetical protein
MNTEEMLIKIKELKIPDKNYSINDSLGTDKYIFRKIYDYWECFYVDERGGQNNDYHRFYDEDKACLYFITMLKRDI